MCIYESSNESQPFQLYRIDFDLIFRNKCH